MIIKNMNTPAITVVIQASTLVLGGLVLRQRRPTATIKTLCDLLSGGNWSLYEFGLHGGG